MSVSITFDKMIFCFFVQKIGYFVPCPLLNDFRIIGLCRLKGTL